MSGMRSRPGAVCCIGGFRLRPLVSKKAESFIIIGNGAAGTTACDEIRKRNKNCSIEIISSENVIGYNRPMLTKGILSEVDPINFFIKPFEWYQANNIKLTLGVTVKEIKEDSKELILENGEKRSYDKLILATGADSFIPPIKGAGQDGVYAIRSLDGVNKIQEFLKASVQSSCYRWRNPRAGGCLGIKQSGKRCYRD